ncbi:MAG TPA: hypothetical protein VIP77_00910 [Jiangellaceae bacterium]
MRFVITSKTNEYFEAGNPPSPELFERMGRFVQAAAANGVLVQADGLLPSAKGARNSAHDGTIRITDGRPHATSLSCRTLP